MDTVKLEKRHQYSILHFHYQGNNSFPNPFPVYRDTEKIWDLSRKFRDVWPLYSNSSNGGNSNDRLHNNRRCKGAVRLGHVGSSVNSHMVWRKINTLLQADVALEMILGAQRASRYKQLSRKQQRILEGRGSTKALPEY
jgi:hypothetical protein